MRLWAVSMVKNEADVVEAFARHTLALFDGLVVLDHLSNDDTPSILERLKAEGLALVLLKDPVVGYFQGSRVTSMARHCFTQHGADFVVPVDADEFVRTPSRRELERAFGAIPPGHYGVHEWRSYVPESFERPFGPHCLKYRLRAEPEVRRKVVIPRTFAERLDHKVAEGCHQVIDLEARGPVPHASLPAPLSTLAHCPIRSARQFEAKVRQGYAAVLAAGGGRLDLCSHWRRMYDDLVQGVALSDGYLRQLAANYSLPRERWNEHEGFELVEDPVALRDARVPAAPSPEVVD